MLLAVYATSSASVAQLAEHHLAKVDVEGSNPFARSILRGDGGWGEVLPLINSLHLLALRPMRCPKCGYSDSKVTDTRSSDGVSSIRRRRLCLRCGHRFFTNETVCEEYPIVIKRSGKEENFAKDKVKISLSKAFKKCAGVGGKVDEIYAKVMGEILANHPHKIHSETIGLIIMELLKSSDPVAYLRFASVHKNFETADDFAFEFKKMSSPKDDG